MTGYAFISSYHTRSMSHFTAEETVVQCLAQGHKASDKVQWSFHHTVAALDLNITKSNGKSISNIKTQNPQPTI